MNPVVMPGVIDALFLEILPEDMAGYYRETADDEYGTPRWKRHSAAWISVDLLARIIANQAELLVEMRRIRMAVEKDSSADAAKAGAE